MSELSVKKAPPDAAFTKQRLDHMQTRVDQLRRQVFHKEVLRGVLPLKAATLPHRSALPEARAREERFRAGSAAYAEALAHRPEDRRIHQMTLDGLRWSAPLMRPDDPALVERYIGQQDFPYRAIAHTREVALGGLMIDIGANVGRMSIPRVILGDVTAAYCAEPDPLNYACLVRNALDNHLGGLVLPDRVALGSSDGTVRLERRRTAGGHRVLDVDMASDFETIDVPSLRLDTWVERVGIDLQQLAFVKMDAQGSEVHILRGAASVLACRHVAWQIEVDLRLLSNRGFSSEDLYGLLERHFTHFTDLHRDARGKRTRPVADLREALAYLHDERHGGTDLLLVNMVGDVADE